MKFNIFKINSDQINPMLKKFSDESVALRIEKELMLDNWDFKFYLSNTIEILDIGWVKYYSEFIKEGSEMKNSVYFSVLLCSNGDNVFAITNGKGHFYVRQFCDYDFGLSMAKRIADESDVKQVATQQYGGKEKKQIKSYKNNSQLPIESGESVDFISAKIKDTKQIKFGKTAKFGSSCNFNLAEYPLKQLPALLDNIVSELSNVEIFKLPKKTFITDKDSIAKYDQELIKSIKNGSNQITSIGSSHDLIGVDFIFSGSESYVLTLNSHKSESLDTLTIESLINFIKKYEIADDKILEITVQVTPEDRKKFYKKIKNLIEFTIEDENIICHDGKWLRFNDDYLDSLNESVDDVEIITTEDIFSEINLTEPEFNKSKPLADLGYISADTDFTQIKVSGNYKIEAWDLKKDDTVFAVKFGTPQKLVYVCNQAQAVLDVIRVKANLKKLVDKPKKYCLWLGLKSQNIPNKISKINSIILKQQIQTFAKKCRQIGLEPQIKLSKKIN